MNDVIISPVGTKELTSVLSEMCKTKNAYRHCGVTPPHYIVTLDAGNGQTTVVRYITDVMRVNNIRRFGGLDQYLEYKLDGSLDNIKQMFSDIRTCAVYTNDYEGVIAVDICALASCVNEQGEFFVSEISKISETATLIFFIGNNPSRGTLLLVEKLKKAIPNINYIHIKPYSVEELTEIAVREIDERGVVVEKDCEFYDILKDAIHFNQCKAVKDILQLVEKIIKSADFSGYSPKITAESLKSQLLSDKKRG